MANVKRFTMPKKLTRSLHHGRPWATVPPQRSRVEYNDDLDVVGRITAKKGQIKERENEEDFATMMGGMKKFRCNR